MQHTRTPPGATRDCVEERATLASKSCALAHNQAQLQLHAVATALQTAHTHPCNPEQSSHRAHAKSIYLTPPLRLDPGTHPAIRRIVAEHHGVMQLRLAPESALFCLKVCHALSTSTSSRRRRFSNHMLRWRKISKGKTAARRRHAARGDRNAFDESNHTSSTALLLIRTRAVDGHTAGSSRAPPGRSLWPDLKWKSSMIVKWGESWPCSA